MVLKNNMTKPHRDFDHSVMFLISFLVVMACITALGLSDIYPYAALMVYLVGVTIFLLLFSQNKINDRWEGAIVWSSYALHVLYVFYKYGLTNIVSPILTSDAGRFFRVAKEYYAGDFTESYTTFPYVINGEFHIFGANFGCCMVTNAAVSMLAAIFVISVLNDFNVHGRPRKFAIFIICFLPYTFQLESCLWREPLYIFLIVFCFYLYSRYIAKKERRYYYLSLLSLVPILVMHIGYFPIAVALFVDALRNENSSNGEDVIRDFVQFSILIVFVIFASNLSSTSYLSGSSGNIVDGIIKRLSGESAQTATEEAGSAYLSGMKVNSIGTLLIYGPLKWIFFLVSPLPINWRGITDVVAFLFDGCIHFYVLWSAFSYLRVCKRKDSSTRLTCQNNAERLVRVGMWAFILCALTFGLGTSTAGTAIRHRDALLGLEALIAGLSFAGCLKKGLLKRKTARNEVDNL